MKKIVGVETMDFYRLEELINEEINRLSEEGYSLEKTDYQVVQAVVRNLTIFKNPYFTCLLTFKRAGE